MSEMNIFIYLAINKIVLTKCFLTMFTDIYINSRVSFLEVRSANFRVDDSPIASTIDSD